MGRLCGKLAHVEISKPAVQVVNTRLEALDYLPNAAYFIKFDLQLVNFAKYGSKTGDLSIRHLHCVPSAVVLHLGRRLRLLGKLQCYQRSITP